MTRPTPWILALALGGCAHGPEGVEQLAAAGHPVSAVVRETPGGGLHAQQLVTARADEHDDDEQDENVPIEDLPQAVIDAVLARWPGATLLEGEIEGNEYGVEFVTAEGEHLEAEFDKHGELQEWEHADEEDDDADDVARAFVEGPAERLAADRFRVLGIEVTAQASPPDDPRADGSSARFVGAYVGKSAFTATAVSPGSELRLGGISQNLEEVDGGWELTLMDRVITIDRDTERVQVEDPLEPGDE